MKKTTRIIVLAGALAMVLTPAIMARDDRTCPALLDLNECRIAIEKVRYAPNITEGITMKESNPDTYNHAIVTLRIDKPEGKAITLASADLTLHYRRTGEEFDIAPCEALSNFTVSLDREDRTLGASNMAGPGWHKVKTGSASRSAGTIYVDAVFAKVEKDIRTMWVCVAQRGTSGYVTQGW